MDKLAQLQAALRAIETGQHLKPVDGVLVRQVLLQPQVKQDAKEPQRVRDVDAKELYRELLALRRVKEKAKLKAQVTRRDGDQVEEAVVPPTLVSPTKNHSLQSEPRRGDAELSPKREQHGSNNHHEVTAEELEDDTAQTVERMQTALVIRAQQLERSEQAAIRADQELRFALSKAQRLLPTQFLFERQLRGAQRERSLEAARAVLLRFQHRFYQLYFRHWWALTLVLRLEAQRRAAAEICRVYRGHQARKTARALRHELLVLRTQARQLLAFRVAYRASQAVKLQMTWRRFLRQRAVKQRRVRHAAARTLQRTFRTRQWRSQTLVNALADARRLFAVVGFQKLYRGHRTRRNLAEARRREKQQAHVELVLLRNASKPARVAWTIQRRGAAFVIAHRGVFPYAMRRRWRLVLHLLRRQRAGKHIANAMSVWFGIDARREAAHKRQIHEWLALVQRERHRSQTAAVLIQKHLRRWVQQRKFLMAEARRKKLAKNARLAAKAQRLQQRKPSLALGWLGGDKKPSFASRGAPSPLPPRSPSPDWKRSRRTLSTRAIRAAVQPPRVLSLLKSAQHRDNNVRVSQASLNQVSAARCVQRCFRSYRKRRSIKLQTWKKKAQQVEARVLMRRQAATQIQRRVRGIHGRVFARQRRAERLLLRFVRRWKWTRVQQRQAAGSKIAHWVRRKRTQQLARLWRVDNQRREVAVVRIQRWFQLRWLLPRHLERVLRVARKREETKSFCEQSLRVCRQHAADAFIVQSLSASLEDALRPLLAESRPPSSSSSSKPRPVSSRQKTTGNGRRTAVSHSRPDVAFPVLQMAFLAVSGWKPPFVWRELDGKTLFQTKLERSKAVALFRALNKGGTSTTGFQQTSPNSPQRQQQPSPATMAGTVGSSPSRRGQKSSKGPRGPGAASDAFTSVDVDVSLAKASGSGKGALDYAAFARVLGLLGDISLGQHPLPALTSMQGASPRWGRFDGDEARVLALLWRSLLSHTLVQSVTQQFEDFVSKELNRRAACIQRLFLRRQSKLRGMTMLVDKRREQRHEECTRAAVVLQTRARVILARRAMRRKMQSTYEKFLDPTWGLPYWLNPRSGFSTWQKPRVLRAEDVCAEPVPFPPPERTLKARCNGKQDCDRCAQWLCYDCDEYFCLECLAGYHKTKAKAKSPLDEIDDEQEERSGTEDPRAEPKKSSGDTNEAAKLAQNGRSEHEMERLRLCGLCQFQLASRRCRDCAPKRPPVSKPKSRPSTVATKPSTSEKPQRPRAPEAEATDDEHGAGDSEMLFCDVCFFFLHKRGGLQTHRAEPLLELCTSCTEEMEVDKDSDVVARDQPRAALRAPGRGDAVQWECESCADPPRRVCGSCALQSHPEESCGQLRAVPLQTLGMRARLKRLAEEQEARDRADLDKMRARALRARQERSAKKLQGFWRSQAPITRARREMAARRRAKSDAWLQHQEDARQAKRLAYRAKNALGLAPPLGSDSPVERRLRDLHALARRQLAIRARFFGLLVDEYVRVGIPLPGLGLLRVGSQELRTTEDLRGWVRRRQTLRLKKLSASQSQPAERALCAWRQLERWGKSDHTPGDLEDKNESSVVVEASGAWLVDIHAKEDITERMVPLALPYEEPGEAKKEAKKEDDEPEDVPVAMFLVEFSLDPKRTVWLNHSLAERFWEWKRLKLLARSERAAQRRRAKEYKEKQKAKELEAKTEADADIDALESDDKQAKQPQAADEAMAATDSAALSDAEVAASNQSWSVQGPNWQDYEAPSVEVTDVYGGYNYASSQIDQAAQASTGYEGYSAEYGVGAAGYGDYSSGYEYGYGYGYTDQQGVSYPEAVSDGSALVDSNDYYNYNQSYGGEGSAVDQSTWYGAEYNAYESPGNIHDAQAGAYTANYDYNQDANVSAGYDEYAGYRYATEATGEGYYQELQPANASTRYYAAGNSEEGEYAYPAAVEEAPAEWMTPVDASYTPGATNYDYNQGDTSSGFNFNDAYVYDNYEQPSIDGEFTGSSAPTSPWEEVFDPETSQTYYVNRLTNETAWELPPG